jgi:hypothetical protein
MTGFRRRDTRTQDNSLPPPDIAEVDPFVPSCPELFLLGFLGVTPTRLAAEGSESSLWGSQSRRR